ncbi:uncharacterized protein PHALS_13989 [Plasmopara halstedii]|uniref:Uncharacterized protein n=1 Tax=Plasmopara halstedii TaxID=4781 RepID=A0A0P1AQ53_PLAHL|nr:uncharacterized protein PHALS_13989 [Plasmopara halstedii]CEG43695.1 hypothetical protein PHALS_13989 [Plasmopara halstedii]|eukprot:XP_024580064.1 hypothetical protein PHALS_13989 [Plasmopara halstedii]
MVLLTWEECGCLLKQLQTAAYAVYNEVRQDSLSDRKLRLRSLLLRILACLREFRQTINITFLQGGSENTFQPELCRSEGEFDKHQLERIRKLLAATKIHTQSTIPTMKHIQQNCSKNYQDELAAVAQVNEVLARHNLPLVDNKNKKSLQVLVTKLRQKEQQLVFHQGLSKAQQHFSGSNSLYSVDNFAYGSTPFTTWLNVFTQQAVLDKLASGQVNLTVFGASIGSLVFFAGLVFGLRSVGVEILEFLHDVAEQFRLNLQISKEKCCFKCADMVTVSVHDVSILLLTSQCWDEALYAQVQTKLELELQSGTLVIDYKNALQKSPHFRLVREVHNQRVSWNSSQSFFIFERK